MKRFPISKRFFQIFWVVWKFFVIILVVLWKMINITWKLQLPDLLYIFVNYSMPPTLLPITSLLFLKRRIKNKYVDSCPYIPFRNNNFLILFAYANKKQHSNKQNYVMYIHIFKLNTYSFIHPKKLYLNISKY